MACTSYASDETNSNVKATRLLCVCDERRFVSYGVDIGYITLHTTVATCTTGDVVCCSRRTMQTGQRHGIAIVLRTRVVI